MQVTVQDFEITDIHDDCLKQSSRYYYYSDLAARAENEYDKLERQLEQLEAETEVALRKKWTAEGTKFTEGLIKSTLASDAALNAKREALLDKKAEVRTLKNALKAIDVKGDMLGNLTRLEVGKLYNTDSTIEASANSVRMQLNSKRINQ